MGEASSGTSKGELRNRSTSAESPPNMPRVVEFPHDFTQRIPREPVQAADPVTTVNLSLRIVWRRTANFAKQGKFQCSGRPCDVA